MSSIITRGRDKHIVVMQDKEEAEKKLNECSIIFKDGNDCSIVFQDKELAEKE